MEGFRARETRSSSETSRLTSDDSVESVEQEEEEETTSQLKCEYQVTEPTTTEWTDEKHSMYLKSMEASFVKQLYNSMDLLGWNSGKDNLSGKKSSQKMHVGTNSKSGQFKVLQSGCWQKVNFRKAEAQSVNVDGPHALQANPWIRHFRTGCRDQVAEPSTLQENAAVTSQEVQLRENKDPSHGLATKSTHFPSWHSRLCRQDSVDSNKEESDQNFINEDGEGMKAGSAGSSKRMKTQIVDGPGNDQVVPFGKCPEAAGVTKNHVS